MTAARISIIGMMLLASNPAALVGVRWWSTPSPVQCYQAAQPQTRAEHDTGRTRDARA